MAARQTPNSDELNYPDKRGTYVKCLDQTPGGLVKPAVFADFRKALGTFDPVSGTYSGATADFEINSILGAGRKLNGPQGAFAKSLAGGDPDTFGGDIVPPAPTLTSPSYAVELVELYWASLMRDVAFNDYATNSIAAAAAKELDGLKANYAGPLDQNGKVTPTVLFRGGGAKFGKNGKQSWFEGETVGPYLSQFCLLPTTFGAQPLNQKYKRFAPNVDYMTDFGQWYGVQRGVTPPGIMNTATRGHFIDGRGLAAFTHADELYEAHFIAYLVMNTLGVPTNPGNPYNSYHAEQPFGTFGGPDITATLAAVAKVALNAVWYQKWVVHLRHRPESGGGIVDMIKTGFTVPGDTSPYYNSADLDSIILDSNAVNASYNRWGSHLLSQAFPEGSPAHPAYPTGHGAVAGACITVLKFFFDGDFLLTNPMVPNADGSDLIPYSGTDVDFLSVNGELHKLAHNISFGHGIHGGIHWRSDTDYSIRLGEEVAVRFLHKQAKSYRETVDGNPFSVSLTRVDGSSETFTN